MTRSGIESIALGYESSLVILFENTIIHHYMSLSLVLKRLLEDYINVVLGEYNLIVCFM